MTSVTFDHVTIKSNQSIIPPRYTLIPGLMSNHLTVLEISTKTKRDGRTDGRTDDPKTLCLRPLRWRRHKNVRCFYKILLSYKSTFIAMSVQETTRSVCTGSGALLAHGVTVLKLNARSEETLLDCICSQYGIPFPCMLE